MTQVNIMPDFDGILCGKRHHKAFVDFEISEYDEIEDRYVCKTEGNVPCAGFSSVELQAPVCVENVIECPITDLIIMDQEAFDSKRNKLESLGYQIKQNPSESSKKGSLYHIAFIRVENYGPNLPLQEIVVTNSIPCVFLNQEGAYKPGSVTPILHPSEEEVL